MALVRLDLLWQASMRLSCGTSGVPLCDTGNRPNLGFRETGNLIGERRPLRGPVIRKRREERGHAPKALARQRGVAELSSCPAPCQAS